jgi:hypothetical protein
MPAAGADGALRQHIGGVVGTQESKARRFDQSLVLTLGRQHEDADENEEDGSFLYAVGIGFTW